MTSLIKFKNFVNEIIWQKIRVAKATPIIMHYDTFNLNF